MEYEDKYTSAELTEELIDIVINGPARAVEFITEGMIDIDKIINWPRCSNLGFTLTFLLPYLFRT